MQTEPEQWAVELGLQIFQTVHESVPNRAVLSKVIALTIQRAFEERERKLREAAIAQPSGDEVEAVARVLDPDIWADDLPVPTRGSVEDFHARRQRSIKDATAAITTYEAVSGVTKMRDALREARSGLCAFTGGPDGACSETIARIDAALGEKP